MPNYRFVVSERGDKPAEAEEIGIFNDEGALRYARRLCRNRTVEVWHQSRLVGTIEPRAELNLAVAAEPAS